jgi:hypothetical protein
LTSAIVVAKLLEKSHPNERAVANNLLAQISLLLHLNPDCAYQLAREVHEQQPKNMNFAATSEKRRSYLVVFPRGSWNVRKLLLTTA